MSKKNRVTIRLPDDTYADIKLLAEQRGVPMAKIVREMLQRYLERIY